MLLKDDVNKNHSQISQTTMIMSSLCEYSEAYIILKGTKTVVGQEADDVAITSNRNNIQVVFKCALFTRCISGINNTQVNIVTELDAVPQGCFL